jgi:methionyl-tRNA formyltransferase
VALQRGEAIAPEDDFGSLHDRLAALGGDLLLRALDLAAEDKLELTEQDEDGATYADKIEAGERRLDPNRPAAELERTVRALTPHIGAYLELEGGGRLGVRSARAEKRNPDPGRLAVEAGALWLGTSEGALRLDVVQPEGGRPMPADAYLRGHTAPDRAV